MADLIFLLLTELNTVRGVGDEGSKTYTADREREREREWNVLSI